MDLLVDASYCKIRMFYPILFVKQLQPQRTSTVSVYRIGGKHMPFQTRSYFYKVGQLKKSVGTGQMTRHRYSSWYLSGYLCHKDVFFYHMNKKVIGVGRLV